MRPTRDLRRLGTSAANRLSRLRRSALRATAHGLAYEARDATVTYCVVEAFNCWHGFSRSLYLSSALGARDGNGRRIRAGKIPRPKTAADALTPAVRRRGRPRFPAAGPPWRFSEEPPWANPSALLEVLDEIGASNRGEVARGVSLPTSVLDHLPIFRNFYAHRGRETVASARALAVPYGISPVLAPTQILLARASTASGPRPQPLLLDWIDDLAAVVDLSI
jgi:hypothetical protein